MTRVYRTENSEFVVDFGDKTVTRIHHGDNPRWHDDTPIPYEFFERGSNGELYFHAVDPATNRLRPFSTSRVMDVS